MGFSSENELDGPFTIVDHFKKPLDVHQDQVPTLVCGHSSGETYGQNVRRKKAERVDVFVYRFFRTSLPGLKPLPDKRYEQVLERYSRVPNFLVRNIRHGRIPRRRVLKHIWPVLSDAELKQILKN